MRKQRKSNKRTTSHAPVTKERFTRLVNRQTKDSYYTSNIVDQFAKEIDGRKFIVVWPAAGNVPSPAFRKYSLMARDAFDIVKE